MDPNIFLILILISEAIIILFISLMIFYIKKIPLFELSFSRDFPEELKPFYKMHKGHYRASAYPRHKVLPVLQRIVQKNNIKNVTVELIAHKFDYGGYNPSDSWFQTLIKILEGGGSVKIVGGVPNEKRMDTLEKLIKAGAQIRLLQEPPKTHIFIYYEKTSPTFIWFELEHVDEKARGIAYTDSPSEKDKELAKNYFASIWDFGSELKIGA
jgi:hypothetical protein